MGFSKLVSVTAYRDGVWLVNFFIKLMTKEQTNKFLEEIPKLPEYLKHNFYAIGFLNIEGIDGYDLALAQHAYDFFSAQQVSDQVMERISVHGSTDTDTKIHKMLVKKFPDMVGSWMTRLKQHYGESAINNWRKELKIR